MRPTNSAAMANGARYCLALVLSLAVVTSPAFAVDDVVEHMQPIVVEPAKSATLPELMTKLRSERLVYVGETHTAVADHRIQLDVLRAMASRPEGLALGVEWFQARFQPVLDDYIAGRIDEAEMLLRTEYYDRWRFDYRLYRPIVRFAREKGIPIIALNASKELTSSISKEGINGIPTSMRDELPDSYDVSDKHYEGQLRSTFEQHGSDDAAFGRFVEVQLTWDESMAQRAADYLRDHPDGRMLVLAGRGHIGGRFGIPNRVARRTALQGKTILRYVPNAGAFGDADYLLLAADEELPPAGMLRVMLDERDDGVFIGGFGKASPAEDAGVKKGDRILAINDRSIGHYVDIKLEMMDRKPGDKVTMKLLRDPLIGSDRTVDLDVTLAPGQ
ncbi:MAG: ChaN family lipoprotein [Gammaproteobacteria bacterium]|nr:ChaN family lipoprotein [Gammaproteobacteria bacterium]